MLNRCSVQTDTGLWMRPAYMAGFRDKTITTLIRTGDRTDPSGPTFIPLNQDIPVRFIKKPGNRDTGVQPVLYDDDGTTVRLVRRVVKKISELTIEDLAGGSPDIGTSELVRWHIAGLNNSVLPDPSDIVTLYYLEHRPDTVESTGD